MGGYMRNEMNIQHMSAHALNYSYAQLAFDNPFNWFQKYVRGKKNVLYILFDNLRYKKISCSKQTETEMKYFQPYF